MEICRRTLSRPALRDTATGAQPRLRDRGGVVACARDRRQYGDFRADRSRNAAFTAGTEPGRTPCGAWPFLLPALRADSRPQRSVFGGFRIAHAYRYDRRPPVIPPARPPASWF